MQVLTVREALLLLLDQVDYTHGACAPTEMVAACLSMEVLTKVREALRADLKKKEDHATGS